MDESNSQPTRCPCGFFGSQQTLGLCSKCFREREQTCNLSISTVPSDLARQVMVSTANGSNGSKLSNGISNGDAQGKKPLPSSNTSDKSLNVFRVKQSVSQVHQSPINSSADEKVSNESLPNTTAMSLLPEPSVTSSTCSCCNDAVEKCRPGKRKYCALAELDMVSAKRQRSLNQYSCCHLCNCRLELAIMEMGKCKCGGVFCQLHRLPEQHNCSYDHKEDGRREARAKMVPARKHVGTTLKRLDFDP